MFTVFGIYVISMYQCMCWIFNVQYTGEYSLHCYKESFMKITYYVIGKSDRIHCNNGPFLEVYKFFREKVWNWSDCRSVNRSHSCGISQCYCVYVPLYQVCQFFTLVVLINDKKKQNYVILWCGFCFDFKHNRLYNTQGYQKIFLTDDNSAKSIEQK